MSLCSFELQADGTGKCPRCDAVAARLPAFRECGHPALPERPPIRGEPIVPVQSGGPGTELMAILSGMGINADETGCKCRSRAAALDTYGGAWARQNLEEIVDWLVEEAERRKWPLGNRWVKRGARVLARRLILLAIRRAEAKVAKNI